MPFTVVPGERRKKRGIDDLRSGDREFKFTQKVPAGRPGYVQGLITNTYLSAAEYDLLATLPAAVLSKTRLSVPPLGIDVFEPPLHGLIMADAEFGTDSEAQSFLPPPAAVTNRAAQATLMMTGSWELQVSIDAPDGVDNLTLPLSVTG